MGRYAEMYARSLNDPETFRGEAAESIHWETRGERVLSEHGVQVMFTAPTAFRAVKQEDPEGRLIGDDDLSRFRTLFLAGERTDPDTLHWAQARLGVPVIDHWWQTETGRSIVIWRARAMSVTGSLASSNSAIWPGSFSPGVDWRRTWTMPAGMPSATRSRTRTGSIGVPGLCTFRTTTGSRA